MQLVTVLSLGAFARCVVWATCGAVISSSDVQHPLWSMRVIVHKRPLTRMLIDRHVYAPLQSIHVSPGLAT